MPDNFIFKENICTSAPNARSHGWGHSLIDLRYFYSYHQLYDQKMFSIHILNYLNNPLKLII